MSGQIVFGLFIILSTIGAMFGAVALLHHDLKKRDKRFKEKFPNS
jgi:Flp pilus assembly protein TadB